MARSTQQRQEAKEKQVVKPSEILFAPDSFYLCQSAHGWGSSGLQPVGSNDCGSGAQDGGCSVKPVLAGETPAFGSICFGSPDGRERHAPTAAARCKRSRRQLTVVAMAAVSVRLLCVPTEKVDHAYVTLSQPRRAGWLLPEFMRGKDRGWQSLR